MKKIILSTLLVALLAHASVALSYQATRGPTELLYWDQNQAFEGYTLFAAHGTTYLIDMAGNVVHSWKIGTNPKLLANGHILDASKNDPSGFGGLVEVDWDGKQVWQYTETRKDYALHHDFVRIYNPKLQAETTLYIANRSLTDAQALAVGADPKYSPYKDAQVDALVEIDSEGNVIWEWWFLDHLIQDDDSTWPNFAGTGKTVADWPGRLDVNLPGRPLKKDWLHCNSLDYNEELDQVVVNAVGGEFYVIDHGNTFLPGDPDGSLALAAGPKGDFLYRYGDPARYAQGDPPSIPDNWTTANGGHKQIGGAHDIHWIRPGLPGAGHFLVFNNGQYLFELTNQSYADEIDPYLGKSGTDGPAYVNPPDAGYTVYEPPKDTAKPKQNVSKQRVWRYGTLSPSGMASHIGGSAQRLANGNTLVCADTEGHFVEVTAAGEVVWEYISPVTKEKGPLTVMPDSIPMTNSVFRALRVAPDDPALAGRVLTPLGPITDLGGQPVTPEPSPEPSPEAAMDVVTQDGAAGTEEVGAEDGVELAAQELAAPSDTGGRAPTDSGMDSGVCGVCPDSQCSGSGCAVTPGGRSGSAVWILLVLAAALGVLRLVRAREVQ